MTPLSFFSPYAHGFVRIAVCTPGVRPADPVFNAAATLELARRAHEAGVAVALFPELGLSAYSNDDLHLQQTLLDAVEAEVARLCEASAGLRPLLAVGAPVRALGRLFNCALLIHSGRLLGAVPKSYLPNYREFYEARWFASGVGVVGREVAFAGQRAPFGTDLLFQATGPCPFRLHAEVCEDLWVPEPPSGRAAMAGAEVLLNLSASNVTIGKAERRRTLCAAQSARCEAVYAYAAAGPGESTTDLAWDGQAMVFELGDTLVESERFAGAPQMSVADVDLGRVRAERLRATSFGAAAAFAERGGAKQGGAERAGPAFRTVEFAFEPPPGALALERVVPRFPYVPADPARLREDCIEAWNIQVQGVAQRLRTSGVGRLVIGVSGGLDSTAALIVAVRAMAALGRPATDVLAYTLPGFGTSEATRGHADALMAALGVTAGVIDIRPAARVMLADLDHPFSRGEPVYDVTFENVQAGLRTDYLFRLANMNGALVLGTGDLSEVGLGWCTYGVGDQMSHYNPNGGVSKTLIQHLIRFAADSGEVSAPAATVLRAILLTEISPELVPADASGAMQSTQAKVGPYALQDFNLFHLTRYGYCPSKIAYLAWCAWHDAEAGDWPPNLAGRDRRAYDLAEIKRWLALFLRRFFANQFKRSAMPNGPKISSGGSLSPRGDWRMPSDAGPAAWLAELQANVPDAGD